MGFEILFAGRATFAHIFLKFGEYIVEERSGGRSGGGRVLRRLWSRRLRGWLALGAEISRQIGEWVSNCGRHFGSRSGVHNTGRRRGRRRRGMIRSRLFE